MIDCAKKISIFKEIIVAKIELDEEIEKFNALKKSGSKKEQSEQLHEIYLIRNEIKSDLSDARKTKFDELLDRRPELRSVITEIPIDLNIELKTEQDLLDALGRHDEASERTLKLVKDFKVSGKEIKKKLVIMQVKTLGFSVATVKQVCDYALEIGLELCPAELAPRLLLQYPDEMTGSIYNFGMESVITNKGTVGILNIINSQGERFLYYSETKFNNSYRSSDLFVFCH